MFNKNLNNNDVSNKNNFLKQRKFRLKFNSSFIRITLMIILGGVFVFTVTKLIINQVEMFKNKKDSKDLIENVVNYGKPKDNVKLENLEEVKINFDELKTINSDVVGWIIFNDKLINNPIVQSSDNVYYLNHTFNNVSSAVGTIFMDYRNKSFDDKNVVLFGHANLDKTMFGSLRDVFKDDFFTKDGKDIIYIYNLKKEVLKYQIFSYYIIETEEFYITTSFNSDASFQNFINIIQKRSFKDLGVQLTTKDNILTLSTCAGTRGTSKRRVIHAKRIS